MFCSNPRTRVGCDAFQRGNDTTPYVKGSFVIASLEETSPAQDDATYSGSLENDGEPEKYPGKTTTTEGGGSKTQAATK